MQVLTFQLPAGLADDCPLITELRSIPGVTVKHRSGKLVVPADATIAVQNACMREGQPLNSPLYIRGQRQKAVRPVETIRGFEKFWPFQRELAKIGAGQAAPEVYRSPKDWRGEIDRDVRMIWAPCGSGKSGIGMTIASAAKTPRAPSLFVTKAAGRGSYLRDAAWAGDYKRIGLLLGRYPASDAVRVAAARLDARFLQRYRDAGVDCKVYVDANEAFADGCDALIVGWETIAVGDTEKQVDDVGIERRKKLVTLRDDLRRAFSVVILDEIHFASNRQSMRGDVSALLAQAGHFVLGMTASGVRSGLADLWAQLALVAPQAWGAKPWKYQLRYLHAVEGDYGGLTIPPAREHFPRRGSTEWPCQRCRDYAGELADRIAHWTEVRDLSVVRSQLPAKTRVFDRIEWPEKVRRSGKSAATSFERALELAADIATPYAVEQAVELLINGAKVVILGQRLPWVGPTVEAVKKALPPAVADRLWCRASYEDGSTLSPIAREAMAAEYMKQPGPALIVGTISALGVSIDLQDTDETIFATLPHTVDDVVQVEGRFNRIGQKRPWRGRYIIPEGTIAEAIYSRLLANFQTVEAAGAMTDDQPWAADAAKTDAEVIDEVKAWLAAAQQESEAA